MSQDPPATHRPLHFERTPEPEMRDTARKLADALTTRRTVRTFSSDPIPLDVVRDAIRAAAQSPSGANKQPWTFVLVTNPELKQKIRDAAEAEERTFYEERAPQRWLDDLKPFATNADKPHLTEAPALIVVFAQQHGENKEQHYYVKESVGLATGVLIAALHLSGLATLTHTPSPMNFLQEVLGRPKSERAFLLLPVGYPTPDCQVPDIHRKAGDAVIVEHH
jgi:iodotyrosine deiodinase